MYPRYHIILGAIFAVVLYYIFPSITFLAATIIFLSSVLIDVDHYLFYVFRKKDLSLINAFNWFVKGRKKYLALSKKQQKTTKKIFCPLHGFEILILLFILGFLHPIFNYILIGFAFHLILDITESIILGFPFHKFSIIYEFIRNKKLTNIENA